MVQHHIQKFSITEFKIEHDWCQCKNFVSKNWWSVPKKFVFCFVTHAPSKLQNDAFFMLWQYKIFCISFSNDSIRRLSSVRTQYIALIKIIKKGIISFKELTATKINLMLYKNLSERFILKFDFILNKNHTKHEIFFFFSKTEQYNAKRRHFGSYLESMVIFCGLLEEKFTSRKN